jgi:hypothetical protein
MKFMVLKAKIASGDLRSPLMYFKYSLTSVLLMKALNTLIKALETALPMGVAKPE